MAFVPALGSRHTIRPLAEHHAVVLTFAALADGAHDQLEVWTNLPRGDGGGWAGDDWHALPFVLQRSEFSSQGHETKSWPVLALPPPSSASSFASPAAAADDQPQSLFAALRIPLAPYPADRPTAHFEFTYRRIKPDGGEEWLGSSGSNGVVEILRPSSDVAGQRPQSRRAQWQEAAVDGAPDIKSGRKGEEWVAMGEGKIGIQVGPGSPWAAAGVVFSETGTPSLLPLPSASSVALELVVLHPASAPAAPDFATLLALSHLERPLILQADAGSQITSEKDASAEVSFFDMGQGKEDLVLRANAGANDQARATTLPLGDDVELSVASGEHALRLLRTSSPALTALLHPSALLLAGRRTPDIVTIAAPASLDDPLALLTVRGDVTLLEPGRGVQVDLKDRGGRMIEELRAVKLRTVVSAAGEPSDVYLGLLDAARTPVRIEDEVNSASGKRPSSMAASPSTDGISSSSGLSTAATTSSNDVRDTKGSQDAHAQSSLVPSASPPPASEPSPGPIIVPITAFGVETLFTRLVALWRCVWKGVLGPFGWTGEVANKVVPRAKGADKAQTQATARTSACPNMPRANINPVAPFTPLATRLYVPSLPTQALISSPAGTSFPTRLRLLARPLSAVQESAFQRLIFRGGEVEELKAGAPTDEQADGPRRWWGVTLGAEGGASLQEGEWEVKAWVADQ